jgi:hypothetical protein
LLTRACKKKPRSRGAFRGGARGVAGTGSF